MFEIKKDNFYRGRGGGMAKMSKFKMISVLNNFLYENPQNNI